MSTPEGSHVSSNEPTTIDQFPAVPAGPAQGAVSRFSPDVERDNEWAQLGEELEYGTELLVEWGVQFYRPYGSHVDLYGDGDRMEAQARAFVASAIPRENQAITVVARRVLYGPWGERNAD